jgi:hypothetical protein
VDESERLSMAGRSFFMGGWLGNDQAWTAYEPEWRRILKNAGVSEFKNSDFANRQREFNHWSDKKADNFLTELLSVIGGITLHGATAILDLAVPKDCRIRPERGAEHFACAYYSLILHAQVARVEYADEGPVEFIFDERTSGVGRVVSNRAKIETHLRLSHPISGATHRPSQIW